MRLLAAGLAVLVCTAASAQPEKSPIKVAPIPAWAKLAEPLPVPENARGMLFVRRQDIILHLDKTGQQFFTSNLIRILHPNALQLGNVSFSWNPAAGSPVVHAVRIHRDGQVRDVLATTQFKVLQREGQLEVAMLDGMLTAALTVPDLRVGDDIEIIFTVPNHDPTLSSASSGFLFLSDKPPPGRYRLELNWDEGQEPKLAPSADLASLVMRGPRSLTYAVDMPGSVSLPKDAPARYAWQRVMEFSDFANWQAVSAQLHPLYKSAAALPASSEVRKEAERIMAAHADAPSRAAAALKLVQQQVRYVYVGLAGGNMTPASAEETWKRRYGDCKGKTALLLALLEVMGIPAEPVLASNNGMDDGLDLRLPGPGYFNHVLVRAQIGDKALWMDGTLPPVVVASAVPSLPYRWVLPLRAAGSALEANPWKPAERPDELALYQIDARAGFDQPAKIRTTTIHRGLAAIALYPELSGTTDEDLLEELKKQLEGGDTWITIEAASWRYDIKNQASVLEISGTGKVNWEKLGKSRELALPGGGFSPPERLQRPAGKFEQVPFYNKPFFDCSVTTVLIPTSTPQREWSFSNNFNYTFFGDTFRRSFEIRDGAVRMIRARRTVQTEISAASAAADSARLDKFDNSKGVIFHDPGSTTVKDLSEVVPGAYDMDWVENDSACLAPNPRPAKR